MEEDTPPLPLSVLLYVEQGHPARDPQTQHWIAQCLEYDVTTQGTSIDSALDDFCNTLAAYISAGPFDGPLATLEPAPDFFWACWETAKPLANARVFWSRLVIYKGKRYWVDGLHMRVCNNAVGPIEERVATKRSL